MNPRIFLLSALLLLALAATASAVDSAPESLEHVYREYLESAKISDAAYQRDLQVRTVFGLAILTGLVVFVIIPLRRSTKRAMAINELQQKTLEEIRDLLKKQ